MNRLPPTDYRLLSAGSFPADFEGKDPNDPEFQALRDQLAEKRRRREARKKAREERQKGKGKKVKPTRRSRKGDKREATEGE